MPEANRVSLERKRHTYIIQNTFLCSIGASIESVSFCCIEYVDTIEKMRPIDLLYQSPVAYWSLFGAMYDAASGDAAPSYATYASHGTRASGPTFSLTSRSLSSRKAAPSAGSLA